MTATLVNYSVSEEFAGLELSNPPANTYAYAMIRQLDEAILKARFDDMLSPARPRVSLHFEPRPAGRQINDNSAHLVLADA